MYVLPCQGVGERSSLGSGFELNVGVHRAGGASDVRQRVLYSAAACSGWPCWRSWTRAPV